MLINFVDLTYAANNYTLPPTQNLLHFLQRTRMRCVTRTHTLHSIVRLTSTASLCGWSGVRHASSIDHRAVHTAASATHVLRSEVLPMYYMCSVLVDLNCSMYKASLSLRTYRIHHCFLPAFCKTHSKQALVPGLADLNHGSFCHWF